MLKSMITAMSLVAILAGNAHGQAPEWDKMVAQKSGSIVTVKLVLEMEISFGGQTQEEETRSEVRGVVVSEDGLIMMAAGPLSGPDDLPMGGQMDIRITPLDMTVVFGNEEKEYDASLVATDAKLDLAFIKVRDLGDRKPAAIDFSSSVKPNLGDRLFSVSRMGKGFDYAPYFSLARVNGSIKKPRRAFMFSGGGSMGLPIFSEAGEVVGVISTIESADDDDDGGGGGGFGGIGRMLRGLTSGGGGLGSGRFILPAKTVKGVIQQAAKRAVELEEKQAAEDKKKESGEDGR